MVSPLALGVARCGRARALRRPVTGTVVEVRPSGVIVEIGGLSVFVERAHLRVEEAVALEGLAGTLWRGHVVELDGDSVTLSAASWRARRRRERTSARIKPKDRASGTVVEVWPGQALVRLDSGLEARLPREQVSWSHVERVGDLLTPGDRVDTRVITIGRDADGTLTRLVVSARATSANPWQAAAEQIKRGTVIYRAVRANAFLGVVVRLTDVPVLDVLIPRKRFVEACLDDIECSDQLRIEVRRIDAGSGRLLVASVARAKAAEAGQKAG